MRQAAILVVLVALAACSSDEGKRIGGSALLGSALGAPGGPIGVAVGAVAGAAAGALLPKSAFEEAKSGD